MRATEMGIEDRVLSALRTNVHAMCVGPVTARPLVRLGVPTSAPERMRLGALARHITDELPLLCSRTSRVAGHLLEIRGTCVLVDGVVKAVSPAGMATIRALAHQPGAVVSRKALLAALPGSGTDTHAVETAVLRLRTALGDKNIVSTVVKRGYRLAVDDEIWRTHYEHLPAHARWHTALASSTGVALIGRSGATCLGGVADQRPCGVRRRARADTEPRCCADLDAPAVVVPAFLSRGYHVNTDIPAHVRRADIRTSSVTDALGPSPQLARVLAERLIESGWRPGDSVILAAAGTSNPTARSPTCTAMAAWVSALTGSTGSSWRSPRRVNRGIPMRLTQLRRRGARRVVVASYLLADGLFQDRLRNSGADAVTDPLGSHPAMVRLIAKRIPPRPRGSYLCSRIFDFRKKQA